MDQGVIEEDYGDSTTDDDSDGGKKKRGGGYTKTYYLQVCGCVGV